MTTDSAMETEPSSMETKDTKQGTRAEGEPVSEEALMKKGKYLFQHLKNLDPLTREINSPEQSSSEK